MEKKVQPVPAGFHTIAPYLLVSDGKAALAFYQQAFNAQEILRMEMPNGKIGHAQIQVGDSPVLVADGCEEWGCSDPQTLKGSTVIIHLYVDSVDSWFERALNAGATMIKPVEDHFYGDRAGMLEDPFGHRWYIATHQEDLTPAEVKRRFEELMAQQSSN